jgi:hypothetical protein
MLSELETTYGRSYTPQELGEFLQLDRRTIVKYAYRWGGVEVAPGTWRFFEKRILEVLNAEFDNETRNLSLPGQRDGKRSNATEGISGRLTKVEKGCLPMGRGYTKRTGERAIQDKYGVFGGK